MLSGVSGVIEVRVNVFRWNASLRPVRPKIVSPLELQIVLAAGTLAALLEPAGIPNRSSEAAEWIVSQVFDGGGQVVGCYCFAVLVFQVDLVIVFHAFPKIINPLVR